MTVMPNKLELIEKIIKEPWAFTQDEFINLVNLTSDDPEQREKAELNFHDLRKMIIRIFDINETTLRQQSDVTRGILGYLNKQSTEKRRNRYFRMIDDGFRDVHNKDKKVIVAEGDSWFQFPVFVQDIIDWLSREPNYAVYSIAYGGDWFTNILYDEKYVEELSIHKPDVFLISGGGNDFIGSYRLAAMVRHKDLMTAHPPIDYQQSTAYQDFLARASSETREQVKHGQQFILPSFYSFLWTLKAQYYKLFCRLQGEKGKYPDMKIITQGYDYALPSFELGYKKWYDLQPLVNLVAGSGGWLKRPLMIQGIKDPFDGRCIVKAMITELNYVLSDLALNYGFEKVHHIDCRGIAKGPQDWWDEIHLHSEGYKKIAEAYTFCIDHASPPKIIYAAT